MGGDTEFAAAEAYFDRINATTPSTPANASDATPAPTPPVVVETPSVPLQTPENANPAVDPPGTRDATVDAALVNVPAAEPTNGNGRRRRP